MADQDMTSLPQRSTAVSLVRWLTFGLLLAVVALVCARMPSVEWTIGIVVVGLIGAGVTAWGIKELFQEAGEVIESLAHTWSGRGLGRRDR